MFDYANIFIVTLFSVQATLASVGINCLYYTVRPGSEYRSLVRGEIRFDYARLNRDEWLVCIDRKDGQIEWIEDREMNIKCICVRSEFEKKTKKEHSEWS